MRLNNYEPMRIIFLHSFLSFIIAIGLAVFVGCGATEKGGAGEEHAEALCDCFKAAGTDDVESCNDMTKKVISALQDSPKEALAFKQEMALCKKDQTAVENK